MLRNLFPRLTSAHDRGAALFERLVAEARRPHWFVEGQVPDTVDGRFAVLATVIALATVRLERGGEEAHAASVALAERFVAAMDAEHRQMGVSDPGIGKQVRKLVAILGRRVEQWRSVTGGEASWADSVRTSLYRDEVGQTACHHCERALRTLWARLEAAPDAAIAQGRIE